MVQTIRVVVKLVNDVENLKLGKLTFMMKEGDANLLYQKTLFNE